MRKLMWVVPLALIAMPMAASAAEGTSAEKPRKVCRTQGVTGRRISKTTCYLPSEWAQIDRTNDEAAKKFIGKVMDNSTRYTGPYGTDAGSMMGIQTPQPGGP